MRKKTVRMKNSIEELIKNLGLAIQEAKSLMNEKFLADYSAFFERHEVGGKTHYEPKCFTLPIPDSETGILNQVKIPIVTLINHNSLAMSEVKVKMNIPVIVDNQSCIVKVVSKKSVPLSSDLEHKDDRYSSCEIDITYKDQPHPESINEYQEYYLRSLYKRYL